VNQNNSTDFKMGTITVANSKTHLQILILNIQFGFTTFHETKRRD